MESRSTVLFFILSICILLYVRALLRRRQNFSGLPYHPGPKPRLIIGNLLDLPTKEPYKEYSKWSTLYGSDVVSFHVPGSHTVIVNSAKAAKALFEKRSAIYSDRSYFKMVYLTGWDYNFGFMPYSNAWRAHRRVIHQHFRPEAIGNYHSLLISRSKRLLHDLLEEPNNAVEHLKHHAGSLPLKLAYDHEVDATGDPLIHKVEEAMTVLAQIMIPGKFLVNSFPCLSRLPEWVPGISAFKHYARHCNSLNDAIRNELFDKTKREMATGSPPCSLLAKVLHKNSQGDLGEYVIKRTFATIHIAAADTSMATLTGAAVALVRHPEVQTRAQTEIDLVVGRERLPDFSDKDNLPYVSAICREVMRWRPVTPLAVSHASTKDDVYAGYFIPKGSTVVGNAWAILHDPDFYPEPERFNPERFMNAEGTLNEDEVLASFGYGRRRPLNRICPGRYLANTTLWLSIASILSVFDIIKSKDVKGNEVEVTTEWVDSGISHPMPFECTVRPRDEKAVELIRALHANESVV
ncbi:cytochrome P450 [Stereum hirsutum FP-91666 SS1]|uniref:cytochrome P450 n=1 Tax=Stereum hirsutum (strain FP-91666) TaxID=721885 RepID=UPI0004449998|nr:cytochrome P450 [Stereum hirsutum FP-91666 SS1]EIM86325.1 cytochrome P450 [Stereum hirsutum FP-91666 SS1]